MCKFHTYVIYKGILHNRTQPISSGHLTVLVTKTHTFITELNISWVPTICQTLCYTEYYGDKDRPSDPAPNTVPGQTGAPDQQSSTVIEYMSISAPLAVLLPTDVGRAVSKENENTESHRGKGASNQGYQLYALFTNSTTSKMGRRGHYSSLWNQIKIKDKGETGMSQKLKCVPKIGY